MIEYIEHHLVDQCNLKCAGCSHFSPICTDWFESIEDFKTNFNKLANLTNKQIKVIRLMGGEPLLHPQINDFLIECRRIFPYSYIELVTNGILLSKKDKYFIDICNQYAIGICVSNYGLLDIQEILKHFKYKRYYDKTQMYNISLDLSGQQNKTISFQNCEMHQLKCYYFQDDKIYPCSVIANIHQFNKYFNQNLYTSKEDMYISINNHTEQEIKAFLNTPREFCKYCNTVYGQQTYHDFQVSKKNIDEWTCPVKN